MHINYVKVLICQNRAIRDVILAGLEFKNDDDGTKYVQNQVSMHGSEKVLYNLINL